MTLCSFQRTRTSGVLSATDQPAGAVHCGGDLLLPQFAARAGHGRPCCCAPGAPTRATPAIVEQTNARRRRDVGLTCRGSVGRNLGDDLANRPLQHSPTPTSTNTVSRRYSQRRRPNTLPDLFDTEEVTGSIPVSPTSVCAAQRLVARSWVTSQLRCIPYIGSKVDQRERAVVVPGRRAGARPGVAAGPPVPTDRWLRANAGSVTSASSTGNAVAGRSAIAIATARWSASTALGSRPSSTS